MLVLHNAIVCNFGGCLHVRTTVCDNEHSMAITFIYLFFVLLLLLYVCSSLYHNSIPILVFVVQKLYFVFITVLLSLFIICDRNAKNQNKHHQLVLFHFLAHFCDRWDLRPALTISSKMRQIKTNLRSSNRVNSHIKTYHLHNVNCHIYFALMFG